MVFEGYCGVYKQVINDKGKPARKFLYDAKCGSVIGVEPHMYKDCPYLFSVEASEKSKFIQIDLKGFAEHMRGLIQDRHDRIYRFLRKQPFIKEVKHLMLKLLPLVLMLERKEVAKDTLVLA